MSEELNDNLPVNENAVDGNENLESQETVSTENQEVEITDQPIVEIAEVAAPVVENQTEEVVEETTAIIEEVIEVAPADTIIEDSEVAMNAIADANAEESEDETLIGRHDIPLQDYEAMPMEKLVEELEVLVAAENVMSVREHVEEIKKAFLS